MLEVPKTADQSLQNKINRSIIFHYLREKGTASRAEIAKQLQISASAVSRVIDTLIKENYVIETEKIKTSVGKRPIQLQINSRKGSILGIDLSQERMQASLFDFTGRLLRKYRGFKITGKKDEASKLIREIRSFLDLYVRENGMSMSECALQSISVGVPADIDVDTGRILSASLYDNWNEINFKELLQSEFKLPVFVEKDVTLSVLAEKNHGQGKDYSEVIFIEISSGVSAGIIANNHLVRGSTGSAGQIAFSFIDFEKTGFQKGNKGYLDVYASIQSIKEKAVDAIQRGKKSALLDMVENNPERIKPALVCRAALNGDSLCNEIIDDVVKLLSIGMINLILIINPQVIVLGGTIANLPDVETLFIERIMGIIKQAVPFRIPEFKISTLGEDVVLIGASDVAVEALIGGEFPYKIGL